MTMRTLMFSAMTAATLLYAGVAAAAAEQPRTCFLIHSSGMHLSKGYGSHAVLEAADSQSPQKLTFTPTGDGYYRISASDGSVLSLTGDYDALFTYNPSSPSNSQYALDTIDDFYIAIRCRANDKYLGVDQTTPGAYAYSDKTTPQYWYLSDNAAEPPRPSKCSYIVTPTVERQKFEGWGVSLCWWANMCGRWSDDKIDRIIDWLVSPEGLNYRIFRYNIGGGDDPTHKNCSEHHMSKGLRAEMEGFKDTSDGPYIWSRDAAQRKIMLKIKEKRPDAVFEAFSNSCPFYMTVSGCCAGHKNAKTDNLPKENYAEFAEYLVDVCRHYKEEYGIEFRTLEPFNEPMTDYWYAGGSQEGCHFDVSSQIEFLKVLAQKLQQSGLSTKISASDETSVSQSVLDFVAYRRSGVLDFVGQWNVHSYSADNLSRAKINALCHESGIRLWMSETGDGGNGLSGNLSVARRLIDDMRFIMPSAWIDWQYIEENDDQWCLVSTDNYLTGDGHRTKNYYVRSQFSRFIEEGSTIITSLNPNTLAALSPDRKTLVLVALTPSPVAITHRADLAAFEHVGTAISAWITDPLHDAAETDNFSLTGTTLSFSLPATSVCTFTIPVTVPVSDKGLNTASAYLICPRGTADLALTASNGEVRLRPITMSDSQQWTLTPSGEGYTMTNLSGDILTERPSSYYLATATNATGSQTFTIHPIDGIHYRIDNSDGSKSIDLEGESCDDNTRIGVWTYADENTEAPVHRQWSLIEVPGSNSEAGVDMNTPPFTTEAPTLTAKSTSPGTITVKCDSAG